MRDLDHCIESKSNGIQIKNHEIQTKLGSSIMLIIETLESKEEEKGNYHEERDEEIEIHIFDGLLTEMDRSSSWCYKGTR